MMSIMARSTVPAPLSLSPSWSYSGNDGMWSTFEIAVGTPPQSFRILPSTTGAETWVPIPDGCAGILVNIANCGNLRGVEAFGGQASRGYETNASSTWNLLGLYNLTTEVSLWGETTAQYGLDTVTLNGQASSQSAKLSSQTVAGIVTGNSWLGSIGLSTQSASFDVHPGSIPSLMESLKSQNYTPSLSFGYTAGAAYNSPQDFGSLVLGGYDQARFKPSNLNFSVVGTNSKTLPVNIASIIAENTLGGGTLSLLPGGQSVTTIIDSTVAQMWLPQNICDLFAQAFGLTFDTTTGLYLVNSTTHRQLVRSNPIVTFTLGSTDGSKSTTNIELPYAAFDLQGGIPLFNTTTKYFPLRVAADVSQQVLGRAFLQEAYVFVDWERDYFTIGQTIHQNSTSNIVPVLAASYDNNNGATSHGLSTGAIAGIAVAACVLIAGLFALAAFSILRSRRRRRAASKGEEEEPMELHGEHLKPPEIMSAAMYELPEGENSKHELYVKPLVELQAGTMESELDGDGERLGRYGWDKKPTTYYEMP